ncbi:hypothetical protein ACFW9D_35300 [Streptomyces sp. NPDC059524]|uniref:hypothetical protein n=1 Tax=Streptomyces sp. NPDC059524 TaxID=3346856 RepID=UPI003693A508
MASTPAETLRSRYVEQAASDLAENRRQQQELTEKIKMLKQEEALLTDILSLTERFEDPATASSRPAQEAQQKPRAQQEVVDTPPVEAPAPARTAAKSAAKPAARPARKSAAKPAPRKATKTAKAAKASKSAKSAKAAEPAKPSGASGTKSGGTADSGAKQPARPLLGDLLAELLGRYEEPRLAKELREELLEKHPDRTPTPQVVRNTLEALVAKGRIQRHKQQRSVMYTLVEQGAA